MSSPVGVNPTLSSVGLDVDRVFSRSLSSFVLSAPGFTYHAVVGFVVRSVLKTLLECVRMQTLDVAAAQQLQLDCEFLRAQFITQNMIVEDVDHVHNMLDLVIRAGKDRCAAVGTPSFSLLSKQEVGQRLGLF